MYAILELVMGFHIHIKMYCIYNNQPDFNLKALFTTFGMFASSISIIVSVIKVINVLQ